MNSFNKTEAVFPDDSLFLRLKASVACDFGFCLFVFPSISLKQLNSFLIIFISVASVDEGLTHWSFVPGSNPTFYKVG